MHSKPESDMEVESGVDLPPPNTGGPKYPWADMDIGDSFTVPVGDEDAGKVADRVQRAGASWCERNRPSAAVRTRQQGDEIRVWMVEWWR